MKHIHVDYLIQDQNKHMLLGNGHEIELFYNNDLLMVSMVMIIEMCYLFVVEQLEEMVEMEAVLIQQSNIKERNLF